MSLYRKVWWHVLFYCAYNSKNVNAVLASIIIAKLGYTSLIGYYLIVYKNYGAALVPNDMSGGAGGWLVD